MNKIINPAIPGFNPDPVICKAGDDYYVATSTFEFYPAVQIYHSKDLVNWKIVDRPIKRISQLDLRGIEPGGGIQAPDLTYKDGKFYLVYTAVFNPTPKCFFITTDKIGGEWSEPKYINSSGIDQSFFHEGEKTYVLTNETVNQKDYWGVFEGNDNRLFQGINIQEYDLENGELIGEPVNIFKGTTLDITEAPHIYKKHGFYYLITAEGGTGYDHAVTVCRSENLYGPYELDPKGPILTAAHRPDLYLQKSGHASIVEDESGNVWLSALATRPTKQGERNGSPFGRESIILRYKWTDDKWLENYYGENVPQTEVDVPWEAKAPQKNDETFIFSEFKDIKNLPLELWTVRQPITNEWAKITNKGLTLKGRNSITSLYDQSSIHRIWQSKEFEFETEFEFNPIHYKQKAGIIQKYSEYDQIVFSVTRKYTGEKMLELCKIVAKEQKFIEEIIIPEEIETFGMRSIVKDENIYFEYKLGDGEWQKVKTSIGIEMLFEQNVSSWGYTGAVVGIFTADEYRLREEATFKNFIYKEKN